MLALLLGVAALAIPAPSLPRRLLGAQTAAALLIPALFVFTVRDTFRANFDLGTWPREILSYADTSPGIPWTRDQLVALGNESGLGNDYPVVVDNEIAWPFVWYLRDYKVQWATAAWRRLSPVASSPSTDHQSWMEPYLTSIRPDIDSAPLVVRRWPAVLPGHHRQRLRKGPVTPSVWNVWRNYFVWRQTSPGSRRPTTPWSTFLRARHQKPAEPDRQSTMPTLPSLPAPARIGSHPR